MPKRTLTREEVRAVDRAAIEEFGLPGVVLMENAGRGAVEVLQQAGIEGPVVLCCGQGNNGGDGFVMARHLENRGQAVRVLLFADPEKLAGDAAVNFRVLQRAGTPLRCFRGDIPAGELEAELSAADWIVDALLGTGLRGDVREPSRSLIEQINAAGKKVFAVDLPSGLDCDTGQPLGVCVRAHHTATFVAEKAGFANEAARSWTGNVQVVDIGVPRVLLARFGLSEDSETAAALRPQQ